ncbi:hypothetical protein A3K93_10080 [Acinetobacter sp. NCu2D-2]|uniref:RadC family protein n=1 Tax=Acinetobacter sp. NCu2D-2 TaxID=1608473 RepID=UPI0007CDDEB2|nr:DNA repair protein RadC [Acinetobacter sp. NCu2D-2]ANF82504.1 hypothetical protein A3K93_10080 [Acinetobacter sp. NCu2D-2]
MQFSIKHWPENERPRERLIQHGAESLSDAELLAIFLRSGSQKHSAVELARLLIQHFGDLTQLLNASIDELSQFHGMGVSKFTQLMAIKELGRRYVSMQLHQEMLQLQDSTRLMDYLRFELLSEQQEVFAVLCLDANLRKIHFKKLFYGSTHYCDISINQILRYAISQNASAIVIAHNHPAAEAQPSPADRELTEQIQKACALVEIQLIDHCIIAKNTNFSFAEHQLINTTTTG